ncbi:MAG: hypothetical protein CVV51_01940 [Spirochaetae bacterium HGW-Spirochaetae-7]|jgi:DNA polymerase-3 subunit gamma/tau|nr:MAG: hypothetical protein CVV51_01940 [Spirochaetae bacterium HGW-Spirochaetae-7]
MFENILGQSEACARIGSDVEREELPGSLLFEGPPLSAKLSAALELARVLSCERGAAWNCPCPQCARHRILVHQDILLLGPKSFREELAIGASMLETSPGPASRYFFVRAARKLARRFDRELYEGEEGRLSKALPLVRSLLEGIDACSPQTASRQIDDATASREATKLLPVCTKLEDMLPASTPVFQIRAMEFWARLAPFGKRKTIIVEHADRMLDGARNALLKILEEPPTHAVFVLTTSRRQAIIPTILSRVRRYRFVQRTGSEAADVLERIFKARQSGAASVTDYVARFRSAASNATTELAREYAAALAAAAGRRGGGFNEAPLAAFAASGIDVRTAIARTVSATSNFGSGDETNAWTFPAFLDAAGTAFSSLLREDGAGIETQRAAERYASLARDAMIRYSSYNLQPAALAERLADSFADPAVDSLV